MLAAGLTSHRMRLGTGSRYVFHGAGIDSVSGNGTELFSFILLISGVSPTSSMVACGSRKTETCAGRYRHNPLKRKGKQKARAVVTGLIAMQAKRAKTTVPCADKNRCDA